MSLTQHVPFTPETIRPVLNHWIVEKGTTLNVRILGYDKAGVFLVGDFVTYKSLMNRFVFEVSGDPVGYVAGVIEQKPTEVKPTEKTE